MKTVKLYWRLNESIRAPELRVIGNDGKQIGILSRDDALEKAKKLELDLVEIAPLAKPPVAKIVNIGKFRYEQEKKLRKEKKKSKSGDLKEVRFSPFIAEHDYTVRLKKVKEFLEENNKVRVVIVFTFKQLGSKKFGYDLISRIKNEFGENIAVDMEAKFLGRNLIMVISPVRSSKKSLG